MSTKTLKKEHYKLLKTVFAIGKHEKDIPPSDLREAVPRWGFPRLSQCSDADLRAIIRRMKRWYVATAEGYYCSQAQLDYMQQLWDHKSEIETKESLEHYLKNHFGVALPRTMSPDRAGKVIQSLKKWD